jgi:hypothetical protein
MQNGLRHREKRGRVMAAAAPTAEVFGVEAGDKPDVLVTNRVGTPTLKARYISLFPVLVKGQTFLFGYDPSQNYLDVYEFTSSPTWLKPVDAKPAIGKAKDIVNAFTLGNLSYVFVYTAKKGIFELYSIADDLSLSQPYRFYRNHELAVSKGFTTLKVFNQFGQVVFLGYRADTGYVATYTVGVTVSSPVTGVPPLQMLPVWSHPWAAGWTRFAFFYLGGEPFFLKTNTKVLNVNIDHVLDTLASGTAEVGTMLQNQLPDALNITNVEAFAMVRGEPYFVTYISSSGEATLNRFHADCLGWTQVAKFSAAPGSTVVAPLKLGEKIFLLFAQ